jgi:hypothetical protein
MILFYAVVTTTDDQELIVSDKSLKNYEGFSPSTVMAIYR